MDLYNLILDSNKQLYARDPQEIIEVIKHFCAQIKQKGLEDDEKYLGWIFQQKTVSEDIPKVTSGKILFQAGKKYTEDEEKEDNRIIQITEDFVIESTKKSLRYLKSWASKQEKIGELYKLKIPKTKKITFIPEDIMEGIKSCDLTEYFKK